jgi:prepilin-type N-terminal cleavage/methylation domain-containing protein
MSRQNRRGFTLAELLVVVAIIGVLVAVSIPIFTSQLDKAKIATNAANIKAAQNAAIVDYMSNDRQNAFWVPTGGSQRLPNGAAYCYNVSSGTFEHSNPQVYDAENGIYSYIYVYFKVPEGTADLSIKTYPYYDSSQTELEKAIKPEEGVNNF